MNSEKKLIEINNLKMYFPLKKSIPFRKKQYLKAVDDVSFYINEEETFGLVGESGSGKSTMGRCIIRLYDQTAGEILYRGREIGTLKERELKPFRRKIQAIFQDPYASLNPTMTVEELIAEPLNVYKMGNRKKRRKIVLEMLDKVGLSQKYMDRYPHEFSGGQRQRIGIARALSTNPEFVLCDEPISALDVSIQAQIINMLEDLQKEMGLTYLFIAHDLSMVRHISQRIGVMYLGKLVEIGESEEIYNNAAHPYTQALLDSVLDPDPRGSSKGNFKTLEGDIPSPLNPPSGCKFVTRCKYGVNKCNEIEPELIAVSSKHYAACHLLDE